MQTFQLAQPPAPERRAWLLAADAAVKTPRFVMPVDTAPAPTRHGAWRRWRDQSALLVALVVAVLLGTAAPGWLTRLDLIAYDALVPRRPAATQPALVVAIDRASLDALGRWPWPHSTHARMIDALHAAGARVIALPLALSEPDGDPTQATALAAAIARHGRVVLPLVPAQDGAGMRAVEPIGPLRAAGAVLGHAAVEIDIDGQARSVYLHAGALRSDHLALGLAVHALMGRGGDASTAQAPAGAPHGPLAASARGWVRDRLVLLPGMPDPPRISYARALQSPEALQAVRGRAVFVGITETGLQGELVSPQAARRTTPAAVDFHARVYESLRADALITPAPAQLQWAFTLVLVSLLALWPLRERVAPDAGTRVLGAIAGMAAALPLLASFGLLVTQAVWYAPVTAVLALLAGLGVAMALHVRAGRLAFARLREHAHATLQAIGDGVVTVDRDAIVRYANQRAEQQFAGGVARGEPVGASWGLPPESLELLRESIDECLRCDVGVRLVSYLRLPTRPGGTRDLRVDISPLHDPRGRIDGAVIVVSDMSDAVASASRLQFAATHDNLTGLPNRTLLHERLTLALARVGRRGTSVAILFLDVNRFKRINDSLGHRLGDAVLKVVAARLQAICRSTDFVARWGGDEFVVLMEDVSGPDAVALAAGKLAAALGEDIETEGQRLACSCSIGIAIAPQDGTAVDELLARADSALARAKSHADDGFLFYSSEIKVWTRAYLAMEVDLRRGLREHQFVLHYQPQFDIRSGRLVGSEALLRWQRSAQELVQPNDFIGVAEETGLIVEIGAWVLMQVARDLAEALAAGAAVLPVAVNVSARQCVNRNIVQVLRSALDATGVPAALIKLEITETTAMTDAAAVAELLQDISALGVRIALDDFGTGYSSLSYLKRFPINELKIDRSFVQHIATNPDDAAIVRATIALAHELGILVVAEGVETQRQNTFLAEQNCDIAQGFLYGRPQPLRPTPALCLEAH